MRLLPSLSATLFVFNPPPLHPINSPHILSAIEGAAMRSEREIVRYCGDSLLVLSCQSSSGVHQVTLQWEGLETINRLSGDLGSFAIYFHRKMVSEVWCRQWKSHIDKSLCIYVPWSHWQSSLALRRSSVSHHVIRFGDLPLSVLSVHPTEPFSTALFWTAVYYCCIGSPGNRTDGT